MKTNDVFITNFWGLDEVCLCLWVRDAYVSIVRLEAIRDYTNAIFPIEEFERINKRLLHTSNWYAPCEEQTVYAKIVPFIVEPA